MSWSISTQGLQPIRSFEAAKEYFERAKQPRGVYWGPHERPLSTNREYHKRIVSGQGGAVYACTLFRTEVVSYRADGGVCVESYNSRSTFDFIYSMLPRGISAYNFRGRMYFKVSTRDGHIYVPDGSHRFDPDGVGLWKYAGVLPKRHRFIYDRSHAAQIRSKFRPFVTYANCTRALLNLPTPRRSLPTTPETYEALLALPPEEWAHHIDRVTPSFYADAELAFGARRAVEIPLTEEPKIVRAAVTVPHMCS